MKNILNEIRCTDEWFLLSLNETCEDESYDQRGPPPKKDGEDVTSPHPQTALCIALLTPEGRPHGAMLAINQQVIIHPAALSYTTQAHTDT